MQETLGTRCDMPCLLGFGRSQLVQEILYQPYVSCHKSFQIVFSLLLCIGSEGKVKSRSSSSCSQSHRVVDMMVIIGYLGPLCSSTHMSHISP